MPFRATELALSPSTMGIARVAFAMEKKARRLLSMSGKLEYCGEKVTISVWKERIGGVWRS